MRGVVKSVTESVNSILYVEWDNNLAPCKFRDDIWRPISN